MATQAGWPGTQLISAVAVSEVLFMGKEKVNLKSRASNLLILFCDLVIISSNLIVTEREMNCS